MSKYQPIQRDTEVGAPSGGNSSSNAGSTSRNRSFRSRVRPLRNAIGCEFLGGLGQLFNDTFGKYLPSSRRMAGYSGGALFALGWWMFIDGAAFALSKGTDVAPVPVKPEDWIPGVMSTVALVIVNLIDKNMLSGGDSSYGIESNVATKARAVAFVGVSIALCSLGCAFAILSLKYIIPGYTAGAALYFGLAITLQNILIFLSSMVLWFGRYGGADEGSFSI